MSRSLSLVVSPDCQRRLHRTIELGMGLSLRHWPLAYAKKSSQGLAVLSMSPTSTPLTGAWAYADAAASNNTIAVRKIFIWGFLGNRSAITTTHHPRRKSNGWRRASAN